MVCCAVLCVCVLCCIVLYCVVFVHVLSVVCSMVYNQVVCLYIVFIDFSLFKTQVKTQAKHLVQNLAKTLASGRQPGESLENASGKSDTKIWRSCVHQTSFDFERDQRLGAI